MSITKNIVYVVLLFFVITLCNAQQQHEFANDTKEISETWRQLLSAIESNDRAKFKALSGTTIKCYDCLENTVEEKTATTQMRATDSTWYERIYDDIIYVPIDDFITDDFDLIFTAEFVKILKEKEPKIGSYDIDGISKFEVLITTVEPSEEFEVMQHAFEFKKFDNEFKFVQISTIP